MMPGCHGLLNATEIDSIYLDGANFNGFRGKKEVYDYLKQHPNSIRVAIYPYPFLVPALSAHNKKYVRSAPDDTPNDNLLQLPRVL
ncbi:MAG: DUF3892 domain-containing protein [Christensenella sp.]